MPALPSEPSIFPTRLLDEPPLHAQRSWWLLHTKPRQEKAVARFLRKREVPFYLPTIRRRRSTALGRRSMECFEPLFRGYVFLLATEDERDIAIRSNRLVHSLPVRNESRLLTELSHLHRMIRSGELVVPEYELIAGQRVRVCHGAMAGLEGTLLRRQSGAHLLVEITMISGGASVKIAEDWVEPLGG